MLSAGLITLREGLEAALIVGIVMGYLVKSGQPRHQRTAWLGVVAAVLASAVLALAITAVGAELEGRAEQIFEGVLMLVAVAVLTWMIFWMQAQARTLKSSIETEVNRALTQGTAWGIFAMSFLAVFREGVETGLFLGAAALQTDGLATLFGALIGLAIASLIGYLIYASTLKLNLRAFFQVTSALLLVFAAGLFVHGIHEFQEAGLLPVVIEQVWDTSAFIAQTSLIGQFLRTLVGYTPTPSLVEVLAYIAYWVATLVGVRLWVERVTRPKASSLAR